MSSNRISRLLSALLFSLSHIAALNAAEAPVAVSDAAKPASAAYQDHSQLLTVKDAAGKDQPVKTKADRAERVAHIRAGMQHAMGPIG